MQEEKFFCTNCGHQVDSDSVFCDDCGLRIEGDKKSSQIVEEIEEVVFRAKKRPPNYLAIFLLVFVVVLAVIVVFISDENSSNTNLQQESEVSQNQLTPDLQLLSIENGETARNSLGVSFSGILKNAGVSQLKGIVIRLDFYKDEDNSGLFDTRFVTIPSVASRGAFTFNEHIPMNPPYTSWWWTWEIIEASYL